MLILAGHESFWTGVFSVLKFIVILTSLVIISLAIRFFMVYRQIKKEVSSMGEDPRTARPRAFRYVFYRKGFSTNPNSSQGGSSAFHQQRTSSQNLFNQSKTIEICPKCGYEKGENHICPK